MSKFKYVTLCGTCKSKAIVYETDQEHNDDKNPTYCVYCFECGSKTYHKIGIGQALNDVIKDLYREHIVSLIRTCDPEFKAKPTSCFTDMVITLHGILRVSEIKLKSYKLKLKKKESNAQLDAFLRRVKDEY